MLDITVADLPAVAEARRAVLAAAAAIGFGDTRAGELALVATELCSNMVKHGGGGRLVVVDGSDRIELLALDRGPGIADVSLSMRDGYSTTGTAGNGLGAARRLAQRLDVLTARGAGTAVYACVERDAARGKASRPPEPDPADCGPDDGDMVAAISVPKAGERACGDGWCQHGDAAGRTLFVVDGLGHGSEAAIVAHAAIRQFQRNPGADPADAVSRLHDALRHTRGGAVAVARIEYAGGSISFAGLGNIAGALVAPGLATRRMVSMPGTAGHNARKVQAFDYDCAGCMVVMHSDGISSSWSPDAWPGWFNAHPLLAAGVLYRDHVRVRDDATVLVARTGRP